MPASQAWPSAADWAASLFHECGTRSGPRRAAPDVARARLLRAWSSEALCRQSVSSPRLLPVAIEGITEHHVCMFARAVRLLVAVQIIDQALRGILKQAVRLDLIPFFNLRRRELAPTHFRADRVDDCIVVGRPREVSAGAGDVRVHDVAHLRQQDGNPDHSEYPYPP